MNSVPNAGLAACHCTWAQTTSSDEVRWRLTLPYEASASWQPPSKPTEKAETLWRWFVEAMAMA